MPIGLTQVRLVDWTGHPLIQQDGVRYLYTHGPGGEPVPATDSSPLRGHPLLMVQWLIGTLTAHDGSESAAIPTYLSCTVFTPHAVQIEIARSNPP